MKCFSECYLILPFNNIVTKDENSWQLSQILMLIFLYCRQTDFAKSLFNLITLYNFSFANDANIYSL